MMTTSFGVWLWWKISYISGHWGHFSTSFFTCMFCIFLSSPPFIVTLILPSRWGESHCRKSRITQLLLCVLQCSSTKHSPWTEKACCCEFIPTTTRLVTSHKSWIIDPRWGEVISFHHKENHQLRLSNHSSSASHYTAQTVCISTRKWTVCVSPEVTWHRTDNHNCNPFRTAKREISGFVWAVRQRLQEPYLHTNKKHLEVPGWR